MVCCAGRSTGVLGGDLRLNDDHWESAPMLFRQPQYMLLKSEQLLKCLK